MAVATAGRLFVRVTCRACSVSHLLAMTASFLRLDGRRALQVTTDPDSEAWCRLWAMHHAGPFDRRSA